MDPSITEGLNATPYITACYAIGAVLLGGYAAWTIQQGRKLRMLQQALKTRSQ